MSDPVLHAVDEEFDERNAVLQLALGIVSSLRRWNRLVRASTGVVRASAPELRFPGIDEADAPPPAEDPTFEHAVLGLLSVSHRLSTHLEPVREHLRRAVRARGRAPARPDPVPSGVLR